MVWFIGGYELHTQNTWITVWLINFIFYKIFVTVSLLNLNVIENPIYETINMTKD